MELMSVQQEAFIGPLPPEWLNKLNASRWSHFANQNIANSWCNFMFIRTFFTNRLTLIITGSTREIHTAETLIISIFVKRERERIICTPAHDSWRQNRLQEVRSSKWSYLPNAHACMKSLYVISPRSSGKRWRAWNHKTC